MALPNSYEYWERVPGDWAKLRVCQCRHSGLRICSAYVECVWLYKPTVSQGTSVTVSEWVGRGHMLRRGFLPRTHTL